MRPVLLTIAGIEISAYLAMLMLAVTIGLFCAMRDGRLRARRINFGPTLGIWILAGGVLGAKLYYCLEYESQWAWGDVVRFWEGGMVFYGGALGGIAGCVAYGATLGIPPVVLCDTVFPYVALGEAITRIGCFLNGCCWGAPTHLPWGICYPESSPAFLQHRDAGLLCEGATCSLPVHPTPLYAMAALFVVFLILRRVSLRSVTPGETTLLYGALYGTYRFLFEFLRDDTPRILFGLTRSQVVSLVLAFLCAAAYGALRARWARRDRTTTE